MKRPLQGLHLHFDPTSGIAGDMTIAALVDAGVPRAVITDAIAAMKVPGLRVSFERRQRGAYVGTGFVVRMPGDAASAADDHDHADHDHDLSGHDDDHDHSGHDHDHDHSGHEHDHDHDHDHAGHDHDHDHDHDHAGHDHDHDHDHAPVTPSRPRRKSKTTPARGAKPATRTTKAKARRQRLAPAAKSTGTRAKRTQPSSAHNHRDYAAIKRLLKNAGLHADVKALAGDIFARIATAEAALHGVPVERIAFHEVGAYDSIADIVGTAAAIVWLAPISVSASPPLVGTGTVRTAHGVVPVPAPATALLLEGIPMIAQGQGERTTPTGAGILAAIVDHFGPAPPMRLVSQGFGAGTKDFTDRANVLRVMLGEPLGEALPDSADEVMLLESNIDDMNPQLVEPLFEALFAAGALDVWAMPITMKKGRPALTVAALAAHDKVEPVTYAFFEHSSTIGVRMSPRARTALARSAATVNTPFGKVAVKLSAADGRVLSATPEYEDCRRLATQQKIPVRSVLAAAAAAAQALLASPERLKRK
ncbi:MAG TPA: nickel pincer cofactor biosynthesis protein LarC [Polyangia bacterium]